MMFAYHFYRPRNYKSRAILSYSAKCTGTYQVTLFSYNSHSGIFEPWSDLIRSTLRESLTELNSLGMVREKKIRFQLFEHPDNFKPTPVVDVNRHQRQMERALKKFDDLLEEN